MKAFVLILSTVLGIAAHAAPESISLSCDGQQLAIGGLQGPVTIQASTAGQTTYHSPWTINVAFQGAPILAPGQACGAPIASGLECTYDRSLPNSPFQLLQRCGDLEPNTGFPRASVEAMITLDGDHGRIYCSNRHGGQVWNIELSGCK
jgi:hypothetical protein